eukprot:gene17394-8993_t
MDSEYDYLFKIIIIGDKRVGKSSIIKRFKEGSFHEGSLPPTIGIDFHIKDVEIGQFKVKLQLWDTAGEEHYKAVTSVYYRGANAAIIVFDLTKPETFENAKIWMDEVFMKCGGDVMVTFVGNKSDMDQRMDINTVDEFTDLYMCHWCETSAKTGSNVNEVFISVAKQLIDLQNQMLSLPSLSNGPGSLFIADEDLYPNSQYCCTYF